MNLQFGLETNFLISEIALFVISSRFSGIKTLIVPVCKITTSHFFSAILISVSVFSPSSFFLVLITFYVLDVIISDKCPSNDCPGKVL